MKKVEVTAERYVHKAQVLGSRVKLTLRPDHDAGTHYLSVAEADDLWERLGYALDAASRAEREGSIADA